MRPQKVQDTEMLQGLMAVLRSRGYDGASLKELSDSTGLKKASLYHRFPERRENERQRSDRRIQEKKK